MTKRRKQQACKPGSVLRGDLRGEVRLIVFAIYLRRLSPDGSSVLPSTSDGQPSQAPPPTRGCARRSPSVVYLNLQLPRRTADMSPCRWWALAPPSHPCLPPRAGGRRLFSSALISRRRLLPFSEVGCPVLPGLSSRFRKGRSPATCRRQTVLLLPAAKLQKNAGQRAASPCTKTAMLLSTLKAVWPLFILHSSFKRAATAIVITNHISLLSHPFRLRWE